MNDLTALTLAQARDGLRRKEFSATELVEAHLDAMGKARILNAYVLETPDQARAMAKAADARLNSEDARPLEGLALGIKDMFATYGVRTTAGSRILQNFVPTYESTVSSNLWRDGAVLLGKLNNDEFAMGSSNETSCFEPSISPWRRRGSNKPLVPGGSSGGSAAAVAARLCLGATGTDTGGSIRQPAAFTGIVGIKPTYGRCSRWGIVAYASSLDQAGPLARSVRDAAILLQSMAGHDPKDATSVDRPVPSYEAAIGASIRNLKIGIPKEYRVEGMAREIDRLWQQGIAWLKSAGAEIDRHLAAAYQIRAARLLYCRAGRSLFQSRPLRWRALRIARSRARHCRHVSENARAGLRQGGAPAHHDRHLCAVCRLL